MTVPHLPALVIRNNVLRNQYETVVPVKDYDALAKRLERAKQIMRETREASAALCRIIVAHGLTDDLPHQYDGFGKRLEDFLAEEEKT